VGDGIPSEVGDSSERAAKPAVKEGVPEASVGDGDAVAVSVEPETAPVEETEPPVTAPVVKRREADRGPAKVEPLTALVATKWSPVIVPPAVTPPPAVIEPEELIGPTSIPPFGGSRRVAMGCEASKIVDTLICITKAKDLGIHSNPLLFRTWRDR
jgi:hypothetical protein